MVFPPLWSQLNQPWCYVWHETDDLEYRAEMAGNVARYNNTPICFSYKG
jgi:hypothetical protein